MAGPKSRWPLVLVSIWFWAALIIITYEQFHKMVDKAAKKTAQQPDEAAGAAAAAPRPERPPRVRDDDNVLSRFGYLARTVAMIQAELTKRVDRIQARVDQIDQIGEIVAALERVHATPV